MTHKTHESKGAPEGADKSRTEGDEPMNEPIEPPHDTRADTDDELGFDPGDGGEDDLLLQVEEYKSRWQRAQADYQNAKRRGLVEQEAAVRRALQPLLDDCLLVLDHLEMALLCPAEGEEARVLAQGVELTRTQFVSILERNGVSPIPEGGQFDPALHQAMETVEVPGAEPGSIVATVRRGFRWGESVLRYAQVKVAAGPADSDAAETASEAD